MVSTQQQHGVGLLATCQEAEFVLDELRDAGFSLEQVGVMTKNSECDGHIAKNERGDRLAAQAQEGATTGAVTGTANQAIGSLLVGFGALAIPGVGTAVEAGTGGIALANTLGSKGVGAFAESWVGALAGIGIPEERAHIYSDRVRRGDCLMMVEGTDEELAKAESLLKNRGIQEWGIHHVPKADKVGS